MRELLRKGKVKEFVMDLINEVSSHGDDEAMLQTRLHAFTFIYSLCKYLFTSIISPPLTSRCCFFGFPLVISAAFEEELHSFA